MDIANSHLEQIVSTSQSNGWKMQWHYMLMEGLVGQQQDPEELKKSQEMQGEESGGQEEIEDASGEGPGGVLENVLENVLGNEPGNGAGEEC
ncbi:hypothetical protein ID866_13028 [Astraeus odoratus]|nr:hypothetical protein ID866_13028 [Astraeus odoratus]